MPTAYCVRCDQLSERLEMEPLYPSSNPETVPRWIHIKCREEHEYETLAAEVANTPEATKDEASAVNQFNLARELTRLVLDAHKPVSEALIELRGMFPAATQTDFKRAFRIAAERAEFVEEERQEKARTFAERFFADADPRVIDAVIGLHLRDMLLQANAETMFPAKLNKSKS